MKWLLSGTSEWCIRVSKLLDYDLLLISSYMFIIIITNVWLHFHCVRWWVSVKRTQTSPLAISPQVFLSKLKTLFFNKSYPDSSSSPCLPPVLTPNFIHHSRLIVCLHDSLDLDPLPIDFALVKHLWISWLSWLCFFKRCWNLEFMIMIMLEVPPYKFAIAITLAGCLQIYCNASSHCFCLD